MKSLAIVRSTDILKLKSTLVEMNRAGLDFEGQPKEINPASMEKALSRYSGTQGIDYEFCALIPLMQDCESSQTRIKSVRLYSEVLILDSSHELFKNLSRMIPVLPDLEMPDVFTKGAAKQESKAKSESVYLGVFVGRKVQVQTGSGTMYSGILRHADSFGVFFEPSDNSSPVFITWHDIKKIIIPRED